MARIGASVSGEVPYFAPDTSSMRFIIGAKEVGIVVAGFSLRYRASPFKPHAPYRCSVSEEERVLLGVSVVCMKTRFHNSRNLSQSHPTPHVGFRQPYVRALVSSISEHGPQGPGITHAPRSCPFRRAFLILSFGTFIFLFHIFSASSSSS